MPNNVRIVQLTQVRLTRAQAHRLIETYACGDVPREDALERLTEAAVTAYNAPREDRVELDTNASGEPVSWINQDQLDRLIFDTESTPPPGGPPSGGTFPDGRTIRTNAREWRRLWRGGDIITETDGDDPGMPRRGRRNPPALTAIQPQRAGGVTRRAAAGRRTAQPLTRPEREGYLGSFWVTVDGGVHHCVTTH